MAVFKCKMCGGELALEEGKSIAQCEYCGSLQTVPSADNEKKLNLFSRANRLRFGCEFDKAAGVYEAIVADFPEEAEAYWGLVLCKYGIEYVDDPADGKKVPTCHRSSFASILEDADFEQALENADPAARKVYREEAKQIEELRKGILEVSSKADPYDIFICYKETDEKGERTIDSVLAQDLYDALTDKGYRVFFARITLEDKLGQEYEPYIFAALNSAKIMLAVGTDYEHYNAVWVRNEWSRYLKLMAEDHTKHLIPCFKGIDAYDIPKEFAKLQAQDLGKVGATQDLLRGIDKLISPAAPVSTAPKGAEIAPLLKLGSEALEKGEWDIASSRFDLALTVDPMCAEAYLGKLMAEKKCKRKDQLAKSKKQLYKNSQYKQAIAYADDTLKQELEGYCKTIAARNRRNLKKAIVILILSAIVAFIAALIVTEANYRSIRKDYYEGKIPAQTAYAQLSKWGWHREADACTQVVLQKAIPGAYPSAKDITSVVIPNGVTTIGEGLFSGCRNLTSITIPDSVTTIGNRAFSYCNKLTSITIPDSVTTIGNRAFSYCDKLTSITIPDSVTSIGDEAFSACRGLTSITIPGSVTSIGDSAFSNCATLESAVIQDGVTIIPKGLFSACEKLASVTIPESVTNLGENAFSNCFALESITIPDGITSIGNRLFSGCRNLISITIPNGVTDIGDHAFSDCKKLNSITIPDGVTTIGEGAFSYCDKLTEITIPSSVNRIGSYAFSVCTGLTSVVISDGVTIIGVGMFSNCKNLTSVVIPNSVNRIGDSAFYACTALTSVTIPESVTRIDNYAFYDCTNLTSVTIRNNQATIGDKAFFGCGGF